MKSCPGLEEKSQCLSDISSMMELIFFFTFSGQVFMIKVCLLKLNEMDEWDRISCQFKGRLVWQIPDKAAAHFLLPVKLKI